jgi:tetratricopeptide (TPR) repeat protein
MHGTFALLFVLIHIAGFNGAAAQTVNQQQCPASNPDLSISGCTALILWGRETPGNLAEAFHNRGLAYLLKDQYDRAIEDFDHAVGLNPNDAWAFVVRGNAYFGKGVTACRPASLPPCALAIAQYDLAIEDFDQAIRLNPNDASAAAAYGQRGVINQPKAISLEPPLTSPRRSS